MSNEIGSRVRYGEAFWRAHHEAWRDLGRQAVSLRRLVITLVSRLVDGAASVLAAEFFSRFRCGYAADPRISAVIPRSRWRNPTVLPSGSSTKMVPIPKSSGSSAEVMSRRRA